MQDFHTRELSSITYLSASTLHHIQLGCLLMYERRESPLTAPKIKVLQQGRQAAHHGGRIILIGCTILPFPGRHYIVALLQLHCCYSWCIRVKHDLTCTNTAPTEQSKAECLL